MRPVLGVPVLLGLVSDRAGRAMVRRRLRATHCLVAMGTDGAVMGCCGLRDARGGAVPLDRAIMRRVCGRAAFWCRIALSVWPTGAATGDLVVDGLAVWPRTRRQGVGRHLLAAVLAEARLRGYAGVQVELAAGNHAALALYRGMGFGIIARRRIRRIIVMRRDIGRV